MPEGPCEASRRRPWRCPPVRGSARVEPRHRAAQVRAAERDSPNGTTASGRFPSAVSKWRTQTGRADPGEHHGKISGDSVAAVQNLAPAPVVVSARLDAAQQVSGGADDAA